MFPKHIYEDTHHPRIPPHPAQSRPHLHKSSALLGELVQLEQIQRLLRHGGALDDGRAALLHEGQEATDPLPAAGGVVNLKQPVQALRLLLTHGDTALDDTLTRG